MRIASLLPSATEIVCAVGLEDQLVAVTHECAFPIGVRRKPVVTASVLSPKATSGTIDRHIRRLVHEGSSIYHLDADRLAALDPDLILTQELCQVCAVSYPIVEAAARRLGGSTQLVSLEPESLSEVFGHLRLVGRLTGRIGEGGPGGRGLQERGVGGAPPVERPAPPRVLRLQWVAP